MNLLESNVKQEDTKTKKIMIILGITIVALAIISIILFIVINQLKNSEFKFIVDNKQTVMPNEDLFVFENDKVYISLKDICSIVDYKYYNGGYKQYSEDNSSCYLESDNEIATLESGSDIIYKTPTDMVDYELFTIDEPVRTINDKLYISPEGISIACNIKFYYMKDSNQIIIYTLPYLTEFYTTGDYSYSAFKDNFNNQKALLYNLLVVQNIDNTKVDNKNTSSLRYGITSLTGEEIVGKKYTNIEFIESTKEFIVTTEENKVGIITADGETKVKPQYDALKQIDKDLNLYLATNNDKKGILEKNGKILIYLEYDEIGVDITKYSSNSIKNPYILYNKVIPVKQNDKWGLFDIKGNIVIPLEWDGIGCVSNVRNTYNTLIIPDVEGIVFARKYQIDERTIETKYGITSADGDELVIPYLDSVYYTINNGREEYTMVFRDTKYDVIDYVNEWSTKSE